MSTSEVRLRVKAYGPVAGSGDDIISASLPSLGRHLEDLFPSMLSLGWTYTTSRVDGAPPMMRVVGVATCAATTMVACGAGRAWSFGCRRSDVPMGAPLFVSCCDREVGAARGGGPAPTVTP